MMPSPPTMLDLQTSDPIQRRSMFGLAALAGSAVLASSACAQEAPRSQDANVSILNWMPVAIQADIAAKRGNRDVSDYFQKALDEAPIGCNLMLPPGDYHLFKPVRIGRQINILGSFARIIGHSEDRSPKPLLDVRIAQSASGGGDIRQVAIEGISVFFAEGDGFALNIENAEPMAANLAMWIERCSFVVPDDSAAAAIRIGGLHSQLHTIIGCQVANQIWLDHCTDACRFVYNNIFGRKPGFRIDLAPGAFKTLIASNTITSHDGAIVIESGSEIDIIMNQIEKPPQATSKSTFIVIDTANGGQSRRCTISGNNFGAGEGLTSAITARSGGSKLGVQDLVIDGNTFGATGSGVDIILADAGVAFTRIGSRNAVRGRRGQVPFVRPGETSPNTIDASELLEINDQGTGTYGVWQAARRLALGDGWAASGQAPLRFRKDEDGMVSFSGALNLMGNGNANRLLAMPDAFQPAREGVVLAASDTGPVRLAFGPDGVFRIAGAIGGVRTLYMDGVRYYSQGHRGYDPGI